MLLIKHYHSNILFFFFKLSDGDGLASSGPQIHEELQSSQDTSSYNESSDTSVTPNSNIDQIPYSKLPYLSDDVSNRHAFFIRKISV